MQAGIDRHRPEGTRPGREWIRMAMWEKHLLRSVGMEYCLWMGIRIPWDQSAGWTMRPTSGTFTHSLTFMSWGPRHTVYFWKDNKQANLTFPLGYCRKLRTVYCRWVVQWLRTAHSGTPSLAFWRCPHRSSEDREQFCFNKKNQFFFSFFKITHNELPGQIVCT